MAFLCKTQAVMDPKNGAYRPRCGISDGWVPARVVADQLKDEDVKVPSPRCGGFTFRGLGIIELYGWPSKNRCFLFYPKSSICS